MSESADHRAEWLRRGRSMLRDAATPLRLWPAIVAGRATAAQLRRATFNLVEVGRVELVDLATAFAARVRSGLMTLGRWYDAFLGIIGPGHVAAAMAGTGTTDLAPADADAAFVEVDRQAAFLAKFRDELRDGRFPLHQPPAPGGPAVLAASGRMLQRSGFYADALWGTAQKILRGKMARDGYARERRVLGSPETGHCVECPALAALGWRPIGSLPGIGESTPCGFRCVCHFEYAVAAAMATPAPG